jgi:hypothetical protein
MKLLRERFLCIHDLIEYITSSVLEYLFGSGLASVLLGLIPTFLFSECFPAHIIHFHIP